MYFTLMKMPGGKPGRSLSLTLLFTLLSLSLLYVSCTKETSVENDHTPSSLKVFSVQGIITDEAGIPLKDVQVRAGDKTGTTDVHGAFLLHDCSFITAEIFVTAVKSGFFNGSRTFIARAAGNNFIRISLIAKGSGTVIASAAGGTVNVVGGGSIQFPANAFAAITGTPYNGQVTVVTHYIDPTSASVSRLMPGDLRGLSLSGRTRGLKTYGMMVAELFGAGGEKLQLRNGVSAVLHYPVVQANAPVSVPLWYYDEATGLWKEEGSATRVGSEYRGNVSHFTFWNADDPYDYVSLSMRVVSPGTQPLSGATVVLRSLPDSDMAYDYTDNNGYVDGYVPVNKVILRTVLDDCGNVIGSDQVGPFTANTTLGNMTVLNPPSMQTLSGTVTSCTGMPVANGMVRINLPNYTQWAPVTNGSFTLTFSNCAGNTTAALQAEDYATAQTGNVITVSLSAPAINNIALGACGISTATSMLLTINGTAIHYDAAPFDCSAQEDSTYIYPSGNMSVALYAIDTSVFTGNYSLRMELGRPLTMPALPFQMELVNFEIQDPNVPAAYQAYYQPLSGSMTATTTEYGSIGQFIRGGFSGQFTRSTLTGNYDTVTVTATYKTRIEL